MINLAGYHFQGGNAQAEEKKSLLFPCNRYEYDINLQWGKTIDLNGNELDAYVCYGPNYELGYQGSTIFHGPYKVACGVQFGTYADDWQEGYTSYYDEQGNEITEQPDGDTAQIALVYWILGEPYPDADVFTSLPEGGFSVNGAPEDNIAYAYPITGVNVFYSHFLRHTRLPASGGLYKLNGRYAATGRASGGSVDIRTGLHQYEGYKPMRGRVTASGTAGSVWDYMYLNQWTQTPAYLTANAIDWSTGKLSTTLQTHAAPIALPSIQTDYTAVGILYDSTPQGGKLLYRTPYSLSDLEFRPVHLPNTSDVTPQTDTRYMAKQMRYAIIPVSEVFEYGR